MKHILVPIDFSHVTDSSLRTAALLARALIAEIVLLHVAAPEPEFIGYEAGPQTVRDAVARQLAGIHKQAQDIGRRLESEGLKVTTLVHLGYTVDKILAEAARLPADFIVMGSHGHGGLRHLLMGSVAEGVLRKATCPVVLVPVSRAG